MSADLHLLRARIGLSWAEVAALCGVLHQTVNRWAAGTRAPSAAHLAILHDLLTRQDRAVAEALDQIERLRARYGEPGVVELHWAPDDALAQARGWPTSSAWLAAYRRVAEAAAPTEVRLVAPN